MGKPGRPTKAVDPGLSARHCLARVLQEAREEAGQTQTEAARIIGLTRQAYAAFERVKNFPKREYVTSLGEAWNRADVLEKYDEVAKDASDDRLVPPLAS